MIGSFVDGSRDVVLLVVRRPQERDQLVDLAVVERPGGLPVSDQTGIAEFGVAADVAAADREHVPDVLLVEVGEQLLLVVQLRADVADVAASGSFGPRPLGPWQRAQFAWTGCSRARRR